MEFKGTKGPWTWRESNFAFHIYGVFKKSQNAFITAAYWKDPSYGASMEEARANARLIAAAPELHALAQRVAALNENAGEIGPGMLVQLVTDARALVIKATE